MSIGFQFLEWIEELWLKIEFDIKADLVFWGFCIWEFDVVLQNCPVLPSEVHSGRTWNDTKVTRNLIIYTWSALMRRKTWTYLENLCKFHFIVSKPCSVTNSLRESVTTITWFLNSLYRSLLDEIDHEQYLVKIFLENFFLLIVFLSDWFDF